MILADTSVWIDFLRNGNDGLARLLGTGELLMHPIVIGELAVGNLHRRRTLLDEFRLLPKAMLATYDEVMDLIEQERLFGLGLGYNDVHLLASARLSSEARLWTKDRRLQDAADRLAVGFVP